VRTHTDHNKERVVVKGTTTQCLTQKHGLVAAIQDQHNFAACELAQHVRQVCVPYGRQTLAAQWIPARRIEARRNQHKLRVKLKRAATFNNRDTHNKHTQPVTSSATGINNCSHAVM
jgi:hypothetical protein